MNAPAKALADDAARRAAIAIHDRSLLVEAGAGSGKTAIMAGRIAMMLAQGIAPKFDRRRHLYGVGCQRIAYARARFRRRSRCGTCLAGTELCLSGSLPIT